jgi:hypothetical protein
MIIIWLFFTTGINQVFFTRVGKSAKSDCYLRQVCPSICPSISMEQLHSYWKNFNEIWYLINFRKSVVKNQISFKWTRITSTLHKVLYTFLIICRSILLRVRNFSDISCRENQNCMFNSFFVKNVPCL